MAREWQALRTLTLVAGALALSACAVSKEARVKAALTDAGIPPANAACMADIMAEDLSTAQLQALGDAAKLARRPVTDVTIAQMMRAFGGVADPQTIGVLVAATTSCIL